MQQTGGLGLGPPSNRHEVAQGGSPRVVATAARGGGARLLSRPVALVEVGAEVRDVSAITPDTPRLLPPRVLVAEGLELRSDVAMMVHILADHHVRCGSIPLGPGVAVLPVPFLPSHGATDDGQAGHPSHVHATGYGTWLWLWVWLLMRKLRGLVDVRDLLQLMRMLRGLLHVRVVRHSATELRFSESGIFFVLLENPSDTLGLGTSAAVERF